MTAYHSQVNTTGMASRWIYQLLALNIVGFLLLFILDYTVSSLADDLDQRQHNEQSKVLIGELIIRDLAGLEAKTYQLFTTSGYKSQQWVFTNVEEKLDSLRDSIRVLEKGGSLERETPLNLHDRDKMTRVITYYPQTRQQFVLEAIDLRPKLEQILQKNRQVMSLLKSLEEAAENSDAEQLESLRRKLDRERQAFPQLFTRMTENASRLFFESQRKLDQIHQELDSKKHFYWFLQAILSMLILLVVVFIGKRVLDQISRSNISLQQLATDLEFMKFAMDQHAIVSTTDVNGVITYVNQSFCDISGYVEQELIGQTHSMLKSNEHSRAFYRDMWSTITHGKVWHGEIKNRTKQGGYHWVAGTIVPFLDEEGKPFQYISIRTDITARKNMEQTIIENNRFLQGLTDNIGEGIYVLDMEGHCQYMNPEAERLLGWTFEEVRDKSLHELVHHQLDEHGHHTQATECSIFTAIHHGRIFRSEDEEFSRKSGEIFPVSVVSMPLYQKGRLAGSVTVFQDISERKQTEFLLADARDKAERANHLKSEFLSNMSHELRTPMNAILGFSELLKLDEQLGEDQLENVAEIENAGHHLLDLINEILDLSKIESGSINLQIRAVDLTAMAHECETLVNTMARQHDVSVSIEMPAELIIESDYTRLKQVLLNLMSNAVKYNHEGGSVTVSVDNAQPATVQLVVADTGKGIPPENLREIFKPFNRLYAENSNIEGTGIGLTITHRIVQQMGGKIDVKSEVNKGSVFCVTLPRQMQPESEDNQSDTADSQPTIIHQAVSSSETKRVLYIEDNHANIRLVERIFRTMPNVELIAVDDPVEGLERMKRVRPDLVLLDIMMPEMDGYQVLEKMQQDETLKRIPAVALTANAMEFDVRRGRDAGFSAYLTKPLEVSTFRETVYRFLVAQ